MAEFNRGLVDCQGHTNEFPTRCFCFNLDIFIGQTVSSTIILCAHPLQSVIAKTWWTVLQLFENHANIVL